MKKILFSVLSVLVLASVKAQIIPDSIAQKPVTITQAMKYHEYIISMMTDKGNADAINYINQVASQAIIDSTTDSLGKVHYTIDTAATASVTTTYGFVAAKYFEIGSKEERLAGDYNTQIKQSLFSQLSANPAYGDLLQIIIQITKNNEAETESKRQAGEQFILSVKK